MRKKVLHILWAGRTGGAERFVRDIVTHSDRERFSHSICFLSEGGALGKAAGALGIPVYSLNMKSGVSVAQGLRFLKVLKDVSPQIIHGHTRNYLINILLRLRPDIKLVYSEHGGSFEPSAADKDIKKYRWFYRWFIRRYDLVLTNADYLREEILKWTRMPQDRVKIYHYGIETSRYGNRDRREVFRREWRVPPGYSVVGIVGRLVEQKGIDDFLRVCGEVSRIRSDCRFVVVGSGPLRERLEQQARESRVEVLFLGDRQDLRELLPAFDIFVVTSRWEPFGIVLLEAMASGIPVAGFRVLGMEAVVEKGGGILIEGRDPLMLARLTVEVLADKNRYEHLVQAGLANVRGNFDIHKNINLLEGYYQDILVVKG